MSWTLVAAGSGQGMSGLVLTGLFESCCWLLSWLLERNSLRIGLVDVCGVERCLVGDLEERRLLLVLELKRLARNSRLLLDLRFSESLELSKSCFSRWLASLMAPDESLYKILR